MFMAGPILTSIRIGCKIKVISKEFIATPHTVVFTYNIATSQTVVFTQIVVLLHNSKLPENNVDFATGPCPIVTSKSIRPVHMEIGYLIVELICYILSVIVRVSNPEAKDTMRRFCNFKNVIERGRNKICQ